MQPTMKALAIGFGLAVAVMASDVWAQRGGGSRGGSGQGAGFSHGGGGHRGGSHHGWGGSHRGWSGNHHGGGGRYGHGGHHHGGHSHSSVHLGFTSPLWYGAYSYPYAYSSYPYAYAYPYSYPYAYPRYSYSYGSYPYADYPPGGVVSEEPDAYIVRTNPDRARRSSSEYWHYCRESNLYYPYARECAGQWEQVPTQPQSAPR
jgi:hypothetical protein